MKYVTVPDHIFKIKDKLDTVYNNAISYKDSHLLDNWKEVMFSRTVKVMNIVEIQGGHACIIVETDDTQINFLQMRIPKETERIEFLELNEIIKEPKRRYDPVVSLKSVIFFD